MPDIIEDFTVLNGRTSRLYPSLDKFIEKVAFSWQSWFARMTVPFISKFLENLTIIPVLKFWLKLRSFVFFMIHAKIVIWSYFMPTSITISRYMNIQISFEPCGHQVKDEHFRAYIIEYLFMLFIKKFINICTIYWITVHPGICDGVRIFWLATRTINKFMLNVFGELHTQFKLILARLSIE